MKDKNLTIDDIKNELKFAADVMRRLPPVKVRGYISSWPRIILDEYEKLFADKKPRIEQPQPWEVSRMDEILEWLKVLNLEEKKLVWKRASKIHWKILCHEFNLHRSNLSEKLKIAHIKIQIHLQQKCPDKKVQDIF